MCLVCALFTHNAMALCEQGPIQIITRLKKGTPVYNHSLSRAEFSRVSPIPVSPNTVGLTVQNLSSSMQFETEAKRDRNETCATIRKIVFEYGYDKIPVYIDKKYPTNSCPYRVTKKHEDYHVAVLQQAISFFEPDIKKKLREVARQVKSQPVRSNQELQNWKRQQQQKITAGMKPLLTHIQNKMNEKNAAIDTPESYRKTTAECSQSSW